MTQARRCTCGRPLPETATICRSCTHGLTRILGDIPDLVDELELTLTRQRAVTYDGASASAEQAVPYHEAAADHLRDIKEILASWILCCIKEKVSDRTLPADDTKACSRWLLWVTDAMARHDLGPTMLDELEDLEKTARRIIDRPADRWPAGPCIALTWRQDSIVECNTDLTAKAGVDVIKCPECGTTYDAAERRAWLLDQAEDRLASATDIARVASWLGDESLSRNTVYSWIKRGQLISHGKVRQHGPDGRTRETPLYRIGDALTLMTRSHSPAA